MHTDDEPTHEPSGSAQTYSPWTIVNLVFKHLVDEGLYPVLGQGGDPGAPAADLLRALGIEPNAAGNRAVRARIEDELEKLRSAVFPDVE